MKIAKRLVMYLFAGAMRIASPKAYRRYVLWTVFQTFGLCFLCLALRVSGAVFYVDINSSTPTPPYTNWAIAATNIQNAIDVARAGDRVLVTNGVYDTGGLSFGNHVIPFRVTVNKALTVQSVNGPEYTTIKGHWVPGTTNGTGAVRCVYLNQGATLSGFTITSGASLMDTATEGCEGGGVFCQATTAIISNCVITGNSAQYYGAGVFSGTLLNCTLSANAAHWYGGAMGGGAAYSVLSNCVLSGNYSAYGGGAYMSTLNNCILMSNYVSGGDMGGRGAGASSSSLTNCTLIGNWAIFGGATYTSKLNNCLLASNTVFSSPSASYEDVLNNCTIVGNSGRFGGALNGGTANNCVVYYNSVTNSPLEGRFSTLNYCCIPSIPVTGVGNFTNEPAFVDLLAGDFRLSSNSPCINSGNNAYNASINDFGGNPRIVGGTIDVGACEFQFPESALSYAWLQKYGFQLDGSDDYGDADADGMNNWKEWRCDTDPTDASSLLLMQQPLAAGSNITVSWKSVPTRSYFLQRLTSITPNASTFLTVATNIAGQPQVTTYTDTNAPANAPSFYRVGVQYVLTLEHSLI